jgi:haloacetate dehalogenase
MTGERGSRTAWRSMNRAEWSDWLCFRASHLRDVAQAHRSHYAMQAFRWFMLAQPAPLPQNLIAATGVTYLHQTLADWTKAKTLQSFSGPALQAYEKAFTESYIAASCADYRAGWTIDRHHDEHDLQSGHTIECPTLALWGDSEFPGEGEMLRAWREIAPGATGQALDCGHFLMEEGPDETTALLWEFFCSG